MTMKKLQWKSTIVPPADATRPKCKVVLSLDGETGKIDEDDTDLIDWLVVIQYETKKE